jgi:hypothetical protein
MHRAKSSLRNLDRETVNSIVEIVDEFDEKVEEGDIRPATRCMERLLGLLEGCVLLTEHASEAEFAALPLPVFSLNKSDRSRVPKLCADMRKIVLSTDAFDHPHKVRISNRIAEIEAEIHKEKGRFDTILGGVVDIGEALGRFGKALKPLTDRMSEVRRITQENTPEYSQIPPPDEIKRIEDQSKREGD